MKKAALLLAATMAAGCGGEVDRSQDQATIMKLSIAKALLDKRAEVEYVTSRVEDRSCPPLELNRFNIKHFDCGVDQADFYQGHRENSPSTEYNSMFIQSDSEAIAVTTDSTGGAKGLYGLTELNISSNVLLPEYQQIYCQVRDSVTRALDCVGILPDGTKKSSTFNNSDSEILVPAVGYQYSFKQLLNAHTQWSQ